MNDVITVKFSREALEMFVKVFNENQVRTEMGVIHLEVDEYRPGEAMFVFHLEEDDGDD